MILVCVYNVGIYAYIIKNNKVSESWLGNEKNLRIAFFFFFFFESKDMYLYEYKLL